MLFQVLKYLSINEEDDISWSLIQAVLSSVARTAIIPMQDVLGLGNSARMNIPATQVKYCDEHQSRQIDNVLFIWSVSSGAVFYFVGGGGGIGFYGRQ